MIIKQDNYGGVNVVKNDKFQYGVTDNEGNAIVPFGKYAWISGYDHGLARVKSISGIARVNLETRAVEETKWGIIDKEGNEVLPVEYDEIWNFLGKGRISTRVIKDGRSFNFDLDDHQMQRFISGSHRSRHYSASDREDEYGSHYGEYVGSYAQDVMGYSDDVINDAYEGDPDAYWNND